MTRTASTAHNPVFVLADILCGDAGGARDINHAAAAASLSPEPKRQRQGRHPASTPPRSTSGLQSRPSAAVTAAQAVTHSSMPQPAATQGVAQFNQQGATVPHLAEAQGSQQGRGLPHLAEAQGLARPSLQALTVPPASEAQERAEQASAAVSTVGAYAPAAAPPAVVPPAPAVVPPAPPVASAVPAMAFVAPAMVPTAAPVAGMPILHQLPPDLTDQERDVILSPVAPPVPSGLFRGVQPTGHGRGGDDGLKTCRACCTKCSRCLVRCTGAHKGKEKQCGSFAEQVKVWQSWYVCRGMDWLAVVPTPVLRNNKWFLEVALGPHV
ncbi:hypothetical protein ABBQ32_000686 [Trebouxia sp. C0010 RCD-2024]